MIKSNKISFFGVLITSFIIFDLEFNSTKLPHYDKNINEIIEIGAVKLDNSLNEIDSFSMTVKPKYTKKLNPYTKKITQITEDELKHSSPFEKVIEEFVDWCDVDNNTCFLTWSDTDLHVMAENYAEFLKKDCVDFITKYTDLQKYISFFIKTENNNQISLKSAAEHFKIDTENFSMHRAEDDSRVCGRILFKSYDKELFNKYIRIIDNKTFYQKLLFKPYVINDINHKDIDKNDLFFECPVCGTKNNFSGKYNKKINAFTNIIKCENCKKKIAVSLRIKKTFDKVTIAKRTREFVKKKKEKE
ncbi:MAG: exonuclease domain-containing protein [Acutalibacteraceae bacterium]